jgi:FixJ family two-component response regulator
MDGEQAFHAIRAINPQASIVLSSGFTDADAVDRLRLHGLAGFVRKPYTRHMLLSEISRFGVAHDDESSNLDS